jgi:drug/metabolite transporter superfamily protein YnfA
MREREVDVRGVWVPVVAGVVLAVAGVVAGDRSVAAVGVVLALLGGVLVAEVDRAARRRLLTR